MIHADLVWRNLWRNPRRSVLTALGVAVAIFVFSALQAAVDGIMFPVRQVASERVLNVRERARANVIASRLPDSYGATIASLPGVAAATGVFTDLAVVGAERTHIFVYGVDPEPYRVVKGLRVPEGAWSRFVGDPGSALVGSVLARQMNWHEGQQVQIRELALSFTVSAILPPQNTDIERHLVLHRGYLQSARNGEGRVTVYLVKLADGASEASVRDAIDQRFRFAPTPTVTVSETAYAEAIVSQFVGFVRYLRAMGWITVALTLLGALNAVSMNVRERTREMGVLRTVGFTPGAIVALVAAESTLVSLAGGVLGLVLARASLGGESATLRGLQLEPSTLALGAGASLLIGLVGGVIPAIGAARVSVVDALRIAD